MRELGINLDDATKPPTVITTNTSQTFMYQIPGYTEVVLTVPIKAGDSWKTVSIVYHIKEGESIEEYIRGLRRVEEFMLGAVSHAFAPLASPTPNAEEPSYYLLCLEFDETPSPNTSIGSNFEFMEELSSDTRRFYTVQGTISEIERWLSGVQGNASLFAFVESFEVEAKELYQNFVNGTIELPIDSTLSDEFKKDAAITIYLRDSEGKYLNGFPAYSTTYAEFEANHYTWTPEGVPAGTYYVCIRVEHEFKNEFGAVLFAASPEMVWFDRAITISVATPTKLTATTTADPTQILVQWNVVGAKAEQYVLQRKDPGDSNFKTVYTGTLTEFTDSIEAGAAANYQYQVKAAGTDWSAPVSVTERLSAPTNVTATGSTAGHLTVAWTDTANTSGVAGYIIQYGTTAPPTSGTWAGMQTRTATAGEVAAKSATFTVAAGTYYARVVAVGVSATHQNSVPSVASTAATVTLTDSVIHAPTELGASNIGRETVTLNWISSTSAGVIAYTVQISTDGGNAWTDITVGGETGTGIRVEFTGATTGIIRGLESASTYRFQVIANTTDDHSAPSNDVIVETLPLAGTVPGAPSFTVGNITKTDETIALAWTAPTTGDVQTGYELRYRTVPEGGTAGGWSDVIAFGASSTGTTISSGLNPNTRYEFELVAVNGSGNSPAATVFVTTDEEPDTPPTPIVFSGDDITAIATHNSITLTWDEVEGATSATAFSVNYPGGAAQNATFVGGQWSVTFASLPPVTTNNFTVTVTRETGTLRRLIRLRNR